MIAFCRSVLLKMMMMLFHFSFKRKQFQFWYTSVNSDTNLQ